MFISLMISGLKEEANANLKPTHVDDEIEVERNRHLNVVFIGHVGKFSFS